MKSLFPVVLSIFIFSRAHALTDIEFSGEVDLVTQVMTLPTGSSGHSSFLVPAFILDMNVPLKESNLLFVSLEGAEKKDLNTSRFDVYTREVYLDLVSPFDGLRALRFGLVPQVWQEAQYEDWEFRFLGHVGKVFTEKYHYLSFSDTGLVYMDELPADWGEWTFSIFNGNGRVGEDTGPHKEFGLFAKLTRLAPWTFSFNYIRGHYEPFDEDVGLKERALALITYRENEEWWAGLEWMEARNPADALRDEHMADDVNVTPWLGENIRSQGGSVFTQFKTGPLASVMLRYDYLNAVANESDKTLNSYLAVLTYQVTEDILSALSVDYTDYGQDYGLGVRNQSKIEVATRVLF